MFVAIVIRPASPACATIAASAASLRALRTTCGSPARESAPLRRSEAATVRVASSTGCRRRCSSLTLATSAAQCRSSLAQIVVPSGSLRFGRWRGTRSTRSP